MAADAAGPTPLVGDDAFVSLYRRFRPGTFAALRGQPHVVRALQGAVRENRVGHAYLFSGPRGTGKTSTARILAKALNCTNLEDGEPCGRCASCIEITRGTSLDVTELDAASNNGVDAMRDLVAHASLGTPGRWKVYIVDEVHMLSNAAANALLKTLEEPPSHVVFVLATTDPQKVPATIRSRTQHLEFRLLGTEVLEGLLREVRDQAGLGLDDAAVASAVRSAKGSARDALSALDQVAAAGVTDDLTVQLAEVIEALCDEDASRTLVALAELHEAGWGPQQLGTELVAELRQGFLALLAPEISDAPELDRRRIADQAQRLGLARLVRGIEVLGRAQVDMRDAPDPQVVLEVALVKVARADLDESVQAFAERLARLERQLEERGSAPSPRAAAPPDAPTPAPATPRPRVAAQPEVAESTPASQGGDPSGRKSLGAVRRSRGGGSVAAVPPVAPPEAPTSVVAPEPAPVAEANPAAPAPHPASGGPQPSREDFTLAWPEVLAGMSARAKAHLAVGRFVDAGDLVALALPNAAHVERSQEFVSMLNAALTAHFAVPCAVVLVVDETGVTDAEPKHELEQGDTVEHFEALSEGTTAAADANTIAATKIFEAFPGTVEVTE